MKIEHLGHACLLVETADQRILIDPGNFSDFAHVKDLTLILVTHQHPDHIDPDAVPALLDANPDARIFAEPAAGAVIRNAAPKMARRVAEMEAYEPIEAGKVTVRPVGDQHARIHDYVDRIDNIGVVIESEGKKLFHPGDALDATGKCLEGINLLCVPVNAPWARISDTVEFVRRIEPGAVIPIHDGLLAPAGRAMYLGHIGNFGLEDGVTIHDLAGQGAVQL